MLFRSYLKALKVGDASLVAPYTALYPIVTVVIAGIFLRERLNAVQAVGFLLAVAAGALFSYVGGDAQQGFAFGPWMLWATGTVVCFGLAAVTQKIATNHISNELSLVCFALSFVPVSAAILVWGGPFDWKLPQRIDMADTGNIDTLAAIGGKAAEGMDWPSIMA